MSAPATRSRDREATERGLIEATLRVLARDGFAALGPNAIAAEAACDKKLIYRYFGGLDGLLEALAGQVCLWFGGAPPDLAKDADYGTRIAAMLMRYAEGLRADPALQRILAWELAESSAPLQRIDAARSTALSAWSREVLAGVTPPPGVDAAAVNAVLIAAINNLTLARRTMGHFAGVDLSTVEGEARIDAALRFLVARAYGVTGSHPVRDTVAEAG